MFIEPSENARIKETVYKKLNGLTFEPEEYNARRKDDPGRSGARYFI
jgi:hypothetical protein